MPPRWFVLLVCSLVLGLSLRTDACAQPRETAVLSGTVTDAETQNPLPGVHIIVAGSLRGTVTDDAGRYQLAEVPLGALRLYASMVGFESAAVDTVLREGGAHTFPFQLSPAIYDLEGVVVTAERDPKWPRRLRAFTREFIGTSPFADETRILNPEVLSFDGGWGRLSAQAQEPLVIENRALGYRITYFLEAFERSGTLIRYDGEPLFEPLVPADSAERARWAFNRKRAYFGSFRHFLDALLAGRCRAEGFRTYRRFALGHPHRRDLTFPLDPQRLLQPGAEPNEFVLDFHRFVEIEYTEERVSDAYRSWAGDFGGRRSAPQRSWIELSDGPTRLDAHGELLDPYGVTVYGYFAFERVAHQLPKEYRPNGTTPLP